ncbi:DUF2125 domain-containing protein [Palleronia caenipelagi]|nr:DUF2125 domain-containing protein [Palleronia caenipelagi]
MRVLIAIVVIAALAWSGYWFIGARALDKGLRSGIEAARAQGMQIETEQLRVTGFPNRFDTMIDDPQIATADGRFGWAGPFLQIFALSYRPNEVIVALPDTHTVTTPSGLYEVTAPGAKASAQFRLKKTLPLDHAQLVAENVTLTREGKSLSMARLLAATRVPEGAGPEVQNIGISVDDLAISAEIAPDLPDAARIVDGLRLDATVGLTGPLDRNAIEVAPVAIRSIDLTELKVDWAGIGMSATGNLSVDARGIPTGPVEVSLANWPSAIDLIIDAGLIPAERADAVRQALSLMALMGGGKRALTVPLDLREGRVFLGPLPIGMAPRF